MQIRKKDNARKKYRKIKEDNIRKQHIAKKQDKIQRKTEKYDIQDRSVTKDDSKKYFGTKAPDNHTSLTHVTGVHIFKCSHMLRLCNSVT